MSWEWRNSGRSTHTESYIVYWGVKNITNFLHKVQYCKQQKTKDKYLFAFGLISKLLQVILMDIVTYDGYDVEADVSMCYVLSVFPKFLNYFFCKFSLLCILDEIYRYTWIWADLKHCKVTHWKFVVFDSKY